MAEQAGQRTGYFFDQMIQSKVQWLYPEPPPDDSSCLHKDQVRDQSHISRTSSLRSDPSVAHRTRFFLEHRDWYDRKGIPYTLGFMFHGLPGTGKTSTVKAIANEGRRHIINVQLSEIKTKAAAAEPLLQRSDCRATTAANTETYTIPVSERLYVIEDIDAMGDTVLRREWKKPTMTCHQRRPTSDPFMASS
jgi:hypothetical protein